MAQQNCITYYSNQEDAFIVHLQHKEVKFTNTEEGFYSYKPSIKKINTKIQMINMVKENKTFFTLQQYEISKQAK